MTARVLVIDDDEFIADSIRLVLEREGYVARTAGSARAALAELDGTDWDLAFVDLVLPDMDGLVLLKDLKARRPGLSAVVITGHGSGSRGFAAREAGAYAFLEKPGDMTPEKILTVVANALGRRKAEQALEAARQQVAMSEKLSTLGTLVSGVAHEIRTPLTYVTNNLYLIRQRLERAARGQPELGALASEVSEHEAAALEGVSRINRLVEDLRRFALREGGGQVEADLGAVVAVAVDLFRATRRGRLDVRASLEPVPGMQVDVGQVQQIVLNLLNNAAEAMPNGGVVRVATRPVPGGGEIEVEDRGSGIAPEIQSKLFQPFFTTKPEGTGLGLSICHRIVEAHEGRIRYDTRPGRGTTFVVFMPAPDSPEAAAAKS
ncbi:MAG: sensor histidine kinase [Candidatus Rokuibacteriota bacterium]